MRDQCPWFLTAPEVRARGAIAGFFQQYRFLSNFRGQVEMYGLLFKSVEHAFVAAKNTPPTASTRPLWEKQIASIRALEKPEEARAAGRRLKLRADWHARSAENIELREWVLLNLIRRKFSDPAFEEQLLATDAAMLIELNTWHDTTYGAKETVAGLTGFNRLGSMLMTVRIEKGGKGIPVWAPKKMPRYCGLGLVPFVAV